MDACLTFSGKIIKEGKRSQSPYLSGKINGIKEENTTAFGYRSPLDAILPMMYWYPPIAEKRIGYIGISALENRRSMQGVNLMGLQVVAISDVYRRGGFESLSEQFDVTTLCDEVLSSCKTVREVLERVKEKKIKIVNKEKYEWIVEDACNQIVKIECFNETISFSEIQLTHQLLTESTKTRRVIDVAQEVFRKINQTLSKWNMITIRGDDFLHLFWNVSNSEKIAFVNLLDLNLLNHKTCVSLTIHEKMSKLVNNRTKQFR